MERLLSYPGNLDSSSKEVRCARSGDCVRRLPEAESRGGQRLHAAHTGWSTVRVSLIRDNETLNGAEKELRTFYFSVSLKAEPVSANGKGTFLLQARLFDEPQLAILCLELIDKHTSEALDGDGELTSRERLLTRTRSFQASPRPTLPLFRAS